MKEFAVKYLDGKIEYINAPSLSLLIADHFKDSESRLKKEVKSIAWRSDGVFYTKNVQEDRTDAQLITADVNPFGWRNE